MSREEKAKQFMPFAALKGYEEALLEKEKVVVSKIELSEERAEELDQWLHQIKKKDILTVVYFSEDTYLQVTGMVSRLDTDARILKNVVTIQRVQFVKCQIYIMAKNYCFGWTFLSVRFHTRLNKTSPSVQCVLIMPLSAIPEYVQLVPYPRAQLYKLHILSCTL